MTLRTFGPSCAICDQRHKRVRYWIDGFPVCTACHQQVCAAKKWNRARFAETVAKTERRVRCLMVAQHGIRALLNL